MLVNNKPKQDILWNSVNLQPKLFPNIRCNFRCGKKMTRLDRDRKSVQNNSRKLRNGCGFLAHLQVFFSHRCQFQFAWSLYLMICLITTRVSSLIFRSVDHTIKNRQQSICQRFPGFSTSYSSRKVGGTLVRQTKAEFVNWELLLLFYRLECKWFKLWLDVLFNWKLCYP